MSNKSKIRNTVACEENEARREGRYNRPATWSPNGKRKCPKHDRRKAKRKLRDWV